LISSETLSARSSCRCSPWSNVRRWGTHSLDSVLAWRRTY